MNIYDRILQHVLDYRDFKDTLELLHEEVVEEAEREIDNGEFKGPLSKHPLVVLLVSHMDLTTTPLDRELSKQICAEFAETNFDEFIHGDSRKTHYAQFFPDERL